jgi:pimeloyl-ACP methyl ester carboxylesterase
MKRAVRGCEIGYDDRSGRGGGGGLPVVLLHPFPFHRIFWAGTTEGLSARRRVIAVDARGFGESSAPDGPLSIADAADDLAALLDALDVPRAALVGMSMGGYTALAFAARHRDRLAALVLADTRAAADTPAARAARADAIALIGRAGVTAYLEASLPRLLRPGAHPALVTQMRAWSETRPRSLVGGIEALRDRPDRSGELAAITCPTLVVGGTDEQVVPPAEMQAMATAIRGARFTALAETGHLASVEAPGPFEAAVAGFLEALPEQRGK